MIENLRRQLLRAVFLLGVVPCVVVVGRPEVLAAQLVSTDVITIARGTSTLVTHPVNVLRVSIGDPAIADAIVVSPREVLVNARGLGTTTLIIWDAGPTPRVISIEVTVDAAALERQLQMLFPNQTVTVTASGELVILSGQVDEAGIARRMLEIARGTGAQVIDNLQVPAPQQILLNVRFAEVSRNALERIGADFLAGETAAVLSGLAPTEGDIVVGSTLSEGLMQLFLFQENIQVSAVVDALRQNGEFRSLAEPSLLALEGQEASFLAGGEFPYPVPQGGAAAGAITIQFREFGVRLTFLPTVTIAGNIRLQVAPEVSQLDRAGGVQIGGFAVPALLTRRAETQVELRPGQTFAIAGLMDNNSQRTVSRVPFLGDIPLLGLLFRRREVRQNRTELLVLVTPRIVQPLDTPPPVPTGEPDTWNWGRELRELRNP